LNILGDEWALAVGKVHGHQGPGNKQQEQQRIQRDKNAVSVVSEDPHGQPSATFVGGAGAIPASMEAINAKSERRKSSVRISVPRGMENMKGIFGGSGGAARDWVEISGVSSEDRGRRELRNVHQLLNDSAQSSGMAHLSSENHKESSIICLVDRLNIAANAVTSSSSPSSAKPSTTSCVGELLRLLPESADVRSHTRQAIIATNSECYHIRDDDDVDNNDDESGHQVGPDYRIVQKQQQQKQEQTSHTTFDTAAGGGLNFTYSTQGTVLYSLQSLALGPHSAILHATFAAPLTVSFKAACSTTLTEERGAKQRCYGSS
jgi:hypothetical protein